MGTVVVVEDVDNGVDVCEVVVIDVANRVDVGIVMVVV